MTFYKEISLRDGRKCVLRSAESSDAADFLAYFKQAHGETNFLAAYPDEASHTADEMAEKFEQRKESDTAVEVCAFVDGRLIGSAGNRMVSSREKLRHRAEFGVSLIREFWSLGIGSALTESCVGLAGEAGFLQLELEAVSDNASALRLYKKYGFVEYGRNPRGFRTREGKWQETVMMRLEL